MSKLRSDAGNFQQHQDTTTHTHKQNSFLSLAFCAHLYSTWKKLKNFVNMVLNVACNNNNNK